MTDADRPVGPSEVPDATAEEALAAAILDGEATAAERARADEPAVAAALAAQRRVAEAVAAAPPVDDAGRGRSIAAALAAWDADGRSAGAAPVDDLARRRAQRATRLLPALGAAAAVVVALVLGGLAIRGNGGDADQTASGDAFDATVEEGDDGAESGAAAGGGSGAVDDRTTTLAAEVAFGSYEDLDGLLAEVDRTAALARAALRDLDAFEEAAGSPPSATAGAAEGQASVGDSSGGAPVAESTCVAPALPEGTYVTGGPAVLDGRPVAVTVVDGPEGTVVQVVDVSTCEVVYEGPPA